MTLRALAEKAGVSFTYLSKIENGKVGYTPAPDTIRALASALDVDALRLLELANKVPPELARITTDAAARRFLDRAQAVASPEDWVALLELLEQRQVERGKDDRGEEGVVG